jgi:hypothetical protein
MLILNVSKQYADFFRDLYKIINISLTYFVMKSIYNDHDIDFSKILETLSFIILGVSAHWLIFKEALEIEEN